MRGDQPVVSAASWIVRASIPAVRAAHPDTVVSRFGRRRPRARARGKLGVALTTTGPGAANTLGAVGEAWASRTPILVIATDIPTTLRRPGVYRGVLHETSGQAEMFAPVVKSLHLGLAAQDVV